jgi:hypothetical protein
MNVDERVILKLVLSRMSCLGLVPSGSGQGQMAGCCGKCIESSALYMMYNIFHMIYLSTAIWLTPGGSSTVQIYTNTIHITTQITTKQHK